VIDEYSILLVNNGVTSQEAHIQNSDVRGGKQVVNIGADHNRKAFVIAAMGILVPRQQFLTA
jgi:hypothetical protein